MGSPERRAVQLARKQNYGFDKRRKEQDRKAKKDAKALDRQQRRSERTDLDVDPAAPGGTPGQDPQPERVEEKPG